MTTVSPHAAGSLVRVKAVLLVAIFLGCGIALKRSVVYENTLLAIAGVSAMLLWRQTTICSDLCLLEILCSAAMPRVVGKNAYEP
jgi:hypothetical protein